VRTTTGRTRLVLAAMVVAVVAAACALPVPPGAGPQTVGGGALGDGNGYAGRDWRERQDAYLRYATETFNPSSTGNLLAHLARSRRDPRYRFDARVVTPADFASIFDKIDTFQDTSDFDMMRLAALWWGYRDRISPDLRAAIEQRFAGFRYWYTDPLPAGVVDEKWFWSENHRLIFHTLEYLAGRALPTTTFAITGEPGSVHAERGRQRISEWLDEKARFGFSEWHSDVYYAKDIEPLLLLTEYAEPDLARRAAAMLDVFMYDIALNQRAGNFGVTHGRSYMKDKSKATDEDVFGAVKVAFGTSDRPYPSRGDATATSMASAERYRLPAVIERVAGSPETYVDHEHMGVPLDIDEPFTTDPVSPVPGKSYTDPEAVPFWWDRAAQTAWQVVPLTLSTIDRYDLWKSELFKPYKPLADLTGGDPVVARQLAYLLRCQINVELMTAVDTVTWRSPHAMLSSAQDYRPGCFGDQYHAWQATLDEDAVVFTTNPGNEPRKGASWVDGDLYWNGAVTMPRSAQHGAAVINIYAPRYPASGPPLDSFNYLPYTHAYFPTERFDEVRRSGNWTFGRKGDGYVALWSWRPTEWRTHDPAVTFTNGLTRPFDLVAPGGANNVWISQVGDARRWGSFDAFAAAMAAAPLAVTDLGSSGGVSHGFDVTFGSPTEGVMHLAWTGPFTVDGAEVALHRDRRFDNPFGSTAFGDTGLSIADGPASLRLDLLSGQRFASQRPR